MKMCTDPSVPSSFPPVYLAKLGHEAESCSVRHLVTNALRYIHGNLILYYRPEYTMSRKILQIIVFARDFMHKLLGFVCAFIIYFFSWILPDLYKNFVAFFVVGEGYGAIRWFGFC